MKAVLEIIYPPVCPFCETVCEAAVCSECRKKVNYIAEPRCKRCGKPVRRSQQEYCSDCQKSGKDFEAGRNLWLHKGVVSDSLYRFKYHNRRINASFYGRQLAEHYGDLIEHWQIEQIIPIPLHRKRKKQRGFNQAGLIAGELGKQTGIPVDFRSLIRQRYTVPQKQLSMWERQANLKNAFRVVHPERIEGCVLLIDDIYTTGNTLNEAAKSLKEAGASKVYFLTISIGQGM